MIISQIMINNPHFISIECNVKDLTRDQLNNLGPNYQKVYRIFQCDIQIFKEINGLKKKI